MEDLIAFFQKDKDNEIWQIDNKKLKTIAFDLDTKALQEYYPKNDWYNSYNDIAVFLR